MNTFNQLTIKQLNAIITFLFLMSNLSDSAFLSGNINSSFSFSSNGSIKLTSRLPVTSH